MHLNITIVTNDDLHARQGTSTQIRIIMQIPLQTPFGNSKIALQEDGIKVVSDYIKNNHPNSRIVIITDTNVGNLYQNKLSNTFPSALALSISPGESSKKLASIKQLCTEILNDGITRSDIIIGVGGGVVTDIAGFVASIYMRGIPFISIPTSLLAMVDAAIGGKTGVDLDAKNILGTFYPAEFILIDPLFLNTLPDREFKNGLAEVIKYAAVLDSSLIDDLMKSEIDLIQVLEKSAKAKIDIVEKDLKESGLRKVLNFGHTFGHAIESISKYELLHGEAISIGMMYANKVAQKMDKQSAETGEQIRSLLKQFKLPTEIPTGIKVEDLVEYIQKDKKRSGNNITFIIAPEIGKYEMIDLTAEELVELAK